MLSKKCHAERGFRNESGMTGFQFACVCLRIGFFAASILSTKAIIGFCCSAVASGIGIFGYLVVMTFARNNVQHSVFHTIYKAVYFINTSAPKPAQVFFQRFWLSNTFVKAIALNILYKSVNALDCLFVLSLPIKIIFPRLIKPDFLHQSTSMSSCSTPLPSFKAFMPRSRCAILLLE